MLNDLRFAARSLFRSRGLTAVALLTLMIGIGATTAIFSVVDTLLLRPLPLLDSERLVRVYSTKPEQQIERGGLAPADFFDYRSKIDSFEHLGSYQWFGHSLGAERPRETQSVLVTAGLLGQLAPPLHGRTFREEESERGKHRVFVASHAFFQSELGGDIERIDSEMILDGETFRLVGVMGPDFSFPASGIEIWAPRVLDPTTDDRDNHWWSAIAKVREGVSIEQAQAELDILARSLEEQYPDSNQGWGINLVPLHQQVVGQVRPALLSLMIAVGLVLLIACANVANLLLARGLSRQGELALRASLGASRGQLVRSLLSESMVLAMAGGVLGLLLARLALEALIRTAPDILPRVQEIALDGRVLVVALAMILMTGLVSGLAPALRLSGGKLADVMRDNSTKASGGRSRLKGLLAISQLALSLVLLIGAGLMLRSFLSLTAISPGFEPDNRLAIQLFVYGEKYQEPESQRVFFERLFEEMRSVPGVASVAGVSSLPMGQLGGGSRTLRVDGRAEPEDRMAGVRDASWGYFETMGIPLVKGRTFAPEDRANSEKVVTINESAARQYFQQSDPIGQRIFMNAGTGRGEGEPVTIVGVVGDVRFQGMDSDPIPEIYFPFEQSITGTQSVVVETTVPPNTLHKSLQEKVWEVDPNQAIWRTVNLETLIEEDTAASRFFAWLIALFATSALLLAAVGLYGVIAYSVAQRTHEIGIRMAIGADSARILNRVLRDAGQLIAVGLALGLALGLGLAIGFSKLLTDLLFQVSPTDPPTFIGVSVLLVLIGILASLAPALRASRLDPIRALRQ